MHDPAALVDACTLAGVTVKPDGMVIFARWAGSGDNRSLVSLIAYATELDGFT
jgi:hypothetical protein